ncbi:MAG: hypothetical protein IK096_03895, partial [Lachnospiraceae bacterium]|nr:hypothetical protein [Lachnospiraceae bacterium]
HTSMDVAAAWAEASGVGKALLVHHDPGHDDVFLNAEEKRYGNARLGFARAGEIVDLGDGS